MTARTESHWMASLEEKNRVILSLTDRVTALQQANDRLAADLAAAERMIERIRVNLCGSDS